MPTEQPSLRIRRATPLDAVNLYKLLVDEEIKSGTFVEHDEAARVVDIINTIATGYVSVVEKSGRIVGSLGFAAGGEPYALSKILDSKWAFLVPALGNTQVPDRMVQRLIEFADKHSAGVRITFAAGHNRLMDFLEEAGFVVRTQQMYREPVVVDEHDEFERAADAAIASDLAQREDDAYARHGSVPDAQDSVGSPAEVGAVPPVASDPVEPVRAKRSRKPRIQADASTT